jgi:signal transduction histidine kinase
VALSFSPDELDLVVSDDGCGPGAVPDASGTGRHEGLRNMRERARRLGGRLSVEGAPGGGTRVVLAVPLDGDLSEDDTPSSDPEREVTHR